MFAVVKLWLTWKQVVLVTLYEIKIIETIWLCFNFKIRKDMLHFYKKEFYFFSYHTPSAIIGNITSIKYAFTFIQKY